MISGPTPVPYGLLFGGDKFMFFFSLFLNENTVGEVRYGLVFSDIIFIDPTYHIYPPWEHRRTIPAHLHHSSHPNSSYPGFKTGKGQIFDTNVCMREFKRG